MSALEVKRFWTSVYGLSPAQKEAARRAWTIFKENPFDPRLGAHRIHRLSGFYGRTICAVEVQRVKIEGISYVTPQFLPVDRSAGFQPANRG